MPLENSCKEYKGKVVFVLPVEGFGWNRIVPTEPSSSIEPPSQFIMEISEFHFYKEMIQAGVGVIKTASHALHGKWVAFALRDRGEDIYNLTTRPGKYNIAIGDKKPNIVIDPKTLAMPEWMQFGDSPHLSGLGFITETETSLDEILSHLRNF